MGHKAQGEMGTLDYHPPEIKNCSNKNKFKLAASHF